MNRSNDGDNNYVIREQLANIQNKNVRGLGGLSLNSTSLAHSSIDRGRKQFVHQCLNSCFCCLSVIASSVHKSSDWSFLSVSGTYLLSSWSVLDRCLSKVFLETQELKMSDFFICSFRIQAFRSAKDIVILSATEDMTLKNLIN